MAKAIFSLFCVAALFNSGLVSANVFDKDKLTSLCNKATGAGGEAVNALGDYVKSLTTQGKEALNKHFQVEEGTLEDTVLDVVGGVLDSITGVGTKLGAAEITKLCGKVGLKNDTIPNNNNGGTNNNNGGTNNNNGGGSNNGGANNNKGGGSSNGGANNNNGGANNNNGGANNNNGGVNTNGGNTVQISILGMFIILVLAIFNH